MSSDNLAWIRYIARQFGIPENDYRLMTISQIQDLATCKAIANGTMTENRRFRGKYIPHLR